MTTQRKIGTALIILGVTMALVGGSLFTYKGARLNPMISDIGMISFIAWLPTLLAGIIVLKKSKASTRHSQQNKF